MRPSKKREEPQVSFETAFRSQHPTVGNSGMFTIVTNSDMNFTKICAGNFVANWLALLLSFIGGNSFVLFSLPMYNDCTRGLPRPIKHQRFIAATIREDKFSVPMSDGTIFVFNTKEFSSASWWFCFLIFLYFN